jgi:hypothetical protein
MRSSGRDYDGRFEIRDEIHERCMDCILGRHIALGRRAALEALRRI